MTSNKAPFETLVAALTLAEKGTEYHIAAKQFDDERGTSWDLNTAYNICRLSDGVGLME